MLTGHAVEQQRNYIFRSCLKMGLRPEEAQDATQDVLVRLWQARDRCAEDYLPAIARVAALNMSFTVLRQRKSQKEDPLSSLSLDAHTRYYSEADGDIPVPFEDEIDGDILALVNRLSHAQRRAFVLRVEGHSMREIGEQCGVHEEIAKDRLARARRNLRQWMRGEQARTVSP